MLPRKIPGYFKARREALKKANPGSVFILPSANELLRNPDVTFPFRQESNFFYLTGFEEPESFLVITSTKTVLFVRHRDPEKEMWQGARYGVEGAMEVFGADEAYVVDEFDSKLPSLLGGAERVYYRLGLSEVTDRRILAALDSYRRSMGRSGRPILPLFDPNQAIAEMRLFKSAEEIDLLRKVSRMTALAHKGVMKDVRPGMTEADVETMINYYFRKEGCQRTSFGTIVAGGKNAACLHYTLNNEILRDGDLLLVDAGGEFEYYAGDISRTFPIGVRFSPAQAKVYDLVLKAQIEAVEMVRPGVTLAEIHQHVCDVMIEGCLSLGILKGKKDEILKTGAYKRVFPHNTSHWIGLDVHDVGLYLNAEGCPRKLEPGMCFSVEPGFYVQPADMETPSEYREIGIRIEDDILVTAKGHEVLTSDVPKTRSDIEALRS